MTTPGLVPSAPPAPTAAAKRRIFADTKADGLATQVGAAVGSRLQPSGTKLSRFVRYADSDALTLVVGEQEGSEVDTALAIGLGERGNRNLRLVLPTGWHEPTVHRWAWLRDELPLEVWRHDGTTVSPELRPDRAQTQKLVAEDEDRQHHLGDRTSWVEGLMRWAGEQAASTLRTAATCAPGSAAVSASCASRVHGPASRSLGASRGGRHRHISAPRASPSRRR